MSEEHSSVEAGRPAADDDIPRLPDRPSPPAASKAPRQLALDLVGAKPVPELVGEGDEWTEYVEPVLVSRVASRRVFLIMRALASAWAIAVVIAAISVRSNARVGLDDGSTVTLLGRVGFIVGLALAAGGWWWSDRTTVNLHRLEARLPSRSRCASAWLAPIALTGLLSVTVLQLAPGKEFDVRPSIVVPIFLAAMWRPLALLRRIITSLTRIGSDALVGGAYVLDLAGFGLLWWQLSSWPSTLDPSNVSTIEVTIGLGAAAAVSLAGSTAVWAALLRDVDNAERHRTVAIRTRFDHRQLRLRGIDPLDPDVRWAMLRIRRAEERARAAESGDLDDVDDVESGEETDPGFEFEAEVWLEEAGLGRQRRVRHPVAGEAPTVATTELFEFDLDDALGRVSERERESESAEPLPEPEPESEPEPEPEPESESESAESLPEPEPEPESESEALPEPALLRAPEPMRMPEPEVVAEPEVGEIAARVDAAPAGRGESPIERLASRMSDAAAGDASAADRRARLAARLDTASGDEGPAPGSLLERLQAFGVSPETHAYEPESVIGRTERTRDQAPFGEPLVNTKAYGLELVRYLMLIAMAVTAATAVWILTRSVSAGDQLVAGAISESDIERIDVARRYLVVATAVMLALVPLWCAVVAVHGRKAGAPEADHRRCLALFGGAVVLNLVAFVFDGDTRSMISSLCILGCLAIVPVAVGVVRSIVGGLNQRTMALTVWTSGLAVLIAIFWVGRLHRPVEASDSLEVLSFFSALAAIMAGIIVVVAMLSTEAIEDALRLSTAGPAEPATAQPVSVADDVASDLPAPDGADAAGGEPPSD
jgi:hypothetical protein